MIVLFTDFGFDGPYVGQMKAVLHRHAIGVPIVDLVADAPRFDPLSAAYLLAAYTAEFDRGTVFLCVVDPGVGTDRGAVAVEADGRWFVGPDNGLFTIVARHARSASWCPIIWRPEQLSASFHGRDLFAPVAARLAVDDRSGLGAPIDPAEPMREWPDDLSRVIYIDRYGNAMSGIRAATMDTRLVISVGGRQIRHATTFGQVPVGSPFWYGNANGLVELAVNKGRADMLLGLDIGSELTVRSADP